MSTTTETKLLDCCKELRDALAAAIRVVVNCGHADVYDYFNREMEQLKIEPGIGVRANEAIAEAEKRI